MISPTLIEETLCRLPDIPYAAVVLDRDWGRRVAVIIPWLGKAIDQAGYLRAVAAEHGQAVATSLLLLPRDTIPLTSQGKPDREAIRDWGGLVATNP
jgi:fatty-acyl-CoA synthase